VRDHDQTGSLAPTEIEEQLAQPFAPLAIQVTEGFVGENDLRSVHERPGHRHPLLLASGEFAR